MKIKATGDTIEVHADNLLETPFNLEQIRKSFLSSHQCGDETQEALLFFFFEALIFEIGKEILRFAIEVFL